jgi:YegS/Rv2252/BmrU family lipid kinase
MDQQYRTAVIVNPASAGGKTGRAWPRVSELLQKRLGAVTVFTTTASREATTLTRQALDGGHTRVISVGGDGTHFEVMNGFFREDGTPLNPEAHIGFLPSGTGSDFTKSLSSARTLEEHLEVLARGPIRGLDLVRLNLRGLDGKPVEYYFQNVARIGIGAAVVRRANAGSRALGGFATFMSATIATLFTYRAKPMRIELDGRVVEQLMMELVVAQGRFDGGGMRTAPRAKLADGFADCYLYGRIGLVDALVNVRRIVSGTMLDRPDIVQHQQAMAITAESPEEVWVEADGELLGSLPASFRVVPGAIRVITGADFA